LVSSSETADVVPTDKKVGATKTPLPNDGVVLQLGGPFGAPAQKVWEFDTVMVVGAGIGVTPFASILRSVNLRVRQQQIIMNACGGVGGWRSRKNSNMSDDDLLLAQVVKVPKKIHFYWIVRSQDELDWFGGLLGSALKGPARELIEMNAFMTGEIELSKIKDLEYLNSNNQFFGRPNWGRIFKKSREAHQGEHVGVFLCGSPLIGKELGEQSAKHTDPPGAPGATRFSFFKEHF